MMFVEPHDQALTDALRRVPWRCGWWECRPDGAEVTQVAVDTTSNLLTDRIVVWWCERGHHGLIGVIDDE